MPQENDRFRLATGACMMMITSIGLPCGEWGVGNKWSQGSVVSSLNSEPSERV
jgi:hypothetical protein